MNPSLQKPRPHGRSRYPHCGSLANNYPFVDGNKRVAFFVTDTFPRINGYCIDCDNEASYTFFMELFETNRFQFIELENGWRHLPDRSRHNRLAKTSDLYRAQWLNY